MDERTLGLLQDRLLVRVIMTHGRPYARIAIYEQDEVALDKIVRLVDHPSVQTCRTRKGRVQLLVQAQGAVVKFCDVVLPYLEESDPLHAELVLARSLASVPWYDRYEILQEFLEEE